MHYFRLADFDGSMSFAQRRGSSARCSLIAYCCIPSHALLTKPPPFPHTHLSITM